MWDSVDSLLERSPHVRALRFHRLELLEARRRRVAGLPPLRELRADEAKAALRELAVPSLLARARGAWDGRLVLVKGPEVALDYPGPRLRPFGDLDLLCDDAPAAQAALIAAGFQPVGDAARYEGIHHLRPLGWPNLPLALELHARPKWPVFGSGPAPAALLAAAVPSRTGVPGVETLPAAHHAVLLAAHAWAHEPLARLGQLVDVAVALGRADRSEARALARAWDCAQLWRQTEAAIRELLDGDGRSLAVAAWARHLRGARERTVLERHVREWLAPLCGLPLRTAPRGLAAVAGAHRGERWPDKLARARLALAHAGRSSADHELLLRERGPRPGG